VSITKNNHFGSQKLGEGRHLEFLLLALLNATLGPEKCKLSDSQATQNARTSEKTFSI
jgi:hypothetical protein